MKYKLVQLRQITLFVEDPAFFKVKLKTTTPIKYRNTATSRRIHTSVR